MFGKDMNITQWSKAITSIGEAMLSLMNCLHYGYNAYIAVKKNGNQEFPVVKKNPELENPFNWESAYGTIGKDVGKDSFNSMEKELRENWIEVFSTQEAAAAYKKDRTLLPGLILGNGSVKLPVRKEDANRYRKEVIKDNYNYDIWSHMWKAKEGIPYYILDETVKNVFVVYYKKENALTENDLVARVKEAADVLLTYADQLEQQKEESDKEKQSLWGYLILDDDEIGYDVYDTQYCLSITAVPVNEQEVTQMALNPNEESYGCLFEREIFRRVKVTKTEMNSRHCIEADWTGLICNNREAFCSMLEESMDKGMDHFISSCIYKLKNCISGKLPVEVYKDLYEQAKTLKMGF